MFISTSNSSNNALIIDVLKVNGCGRSYVSKMLRLQRTLFSPQLRGICFHHPQRNLSLTSFVTQEKHLSGPASQSAIYRPYKQGDWNNPIGNEVNRTAIKTRTNDQIWLEKSEEARKQLALHPPPDPYAGLNLPAWMLF